MKTFILVFLLGSSAFAQANLPNFGSAQMVGRVAAFPSPRGTTWYLPLALSPQLECSPDAAKRSCIVKVVNWLSPQESARLSQMQTQSRSGVAPVTPINPMVVRSVAEHFEGLPQGFQSSEMKLQTLALNERGPYASVALRGDGSAIASVEQQFESSGVGSFESEVVLNAESVAEYIAIQNTDALRSALSGLSGRYSRSDMLASISRVVATLDLQTFNVDAGEARQIAAEQIRSLFFRYTRFKGYEVVLDQMPKTLVLRDEHSAPYQVRCLVNLQLKAGAVPQVACLPEGQ